MLKIHQAESLSGGAMPVAVLMSALLKERRFG
jgi:hypothetical protein